MAKRTCSIDGCDGAHEARGWCNIHYTRWRLKGDPGPVDSLRRPDRGCSVTDCDRKHSCKDLCELHYERLWRTGSVEDPHAPRPIDVKVIDGERVGVVPLTRGAVSIVDVQDIPKLEGHLWFAMPGRRTTYAAYGQDGRTVRMHRFLLDPPADAMIDHIDHDGLNNRRSNLRVVTHQQNMMNQQANRGSTSPLKGVSRRPERRLQWIAQIKDTHIGSFATEIEAAEAYDAAARKEFGPYATLNFPDP